MSWTPRCGDRGDHALELLLVADLDRHFDDGAVCSAAVGAPGFEAPDIVCSLKSTAVN